jgi:hypothetical protein
VYIAGTPDGVARASAAIATVLESIEGREH